MAIRLADFRISLGVERFNLLLATASPHIVDDDRHVLTVWVFIRNGADILYSSLQRGIVPAVQPGLTGFQCQFSFVLLAGRCRPVGAVTGQPVRDDPVYFVLGEKLTACPLCAGVSFGGLQITGVLLHDSVNYHIRQGLAVYLEIFQEFFLHVVLLLTP